jgi:RNA polymerase sigma-70 factor (ECF subfamily)
MPELLFRIARERSETAFRDLFNEFGPKVRSYMRRQGVDAATADELAQETLLTVWRKAALYSAAKGTPASWIFTIARNIRIDRIRREVGWQELTETEADTIPSDEQPPDETVSAAQRQARVQTVLAELPSEQREVVVLAFIDGLSHADIAGRLSLPLGTVKSRMRLAYQKVRTALEDLQ